MRSSYEVVDCNEKVVFAGSYFACKSWLEEFAWNNEKHYRIAKRR